MDTALNEIEALKGGMAKRSAAMPLTA